MTLAAAWNADTQLDAREPGRAHLERGHAQSGYPTAATMTSRCVGSQTWSAGVAPGPRDFIEPDNSIHLHILAELRQEGGVPLAN